MLAWRVGADLRRGALASELLVVDGRTGETVLRRSCFDYHRVAITSDGARVATVPAGRGHRGGRSYNGRSDRGASARRLSAAQREAEVRQAFEGTRSIRFVSVGESNQASTSTTFPSATRITQQ